MTPNEPRFLLVDLHKNNATPLTTDEVQVAFFRLELDQPKDSAYLDNENKVRTCRKET